MTRRSGAVATDPDLALLLRLRKNGVPVVAVFLTGRPRGVTAELEASNAFVVAWLPVARAAASPMSCSVRIVEQ
jgi:hypothetical protein